MVRRLILDSSKFARYFSTTTRGVLESSTSASSSCSIRHFSVPKSIHGSPLVSLRTGESKALSSLARSHSDVDFILHSEHHQEASSPKPHCNTCTCAQHEGSEDYVLSEATEESFYACGKSINPQEEAELPPAMPEPTYSVHKRVLPSSLVALSSQQGRQWLLECLQNDTAESYWALMEQFTNQSDPAFCGVTTLLVVLNALGVDPLVRWRGGWRFYGSEDVLLNRCCIPMERVRRVGITLEEFVLLGKCQGLRVTLRRPVMGEEQALDDESRIRDIETFRQDIRRILRSSENQQQHGILVVSFSRAALGQTGEGHFSPIAAYHEESDHVLLLDVARFKYAPYWVSVLDLYNAMLPLDEATQKPRGWFVCEPPQRKHGYQGPTTTTETRRPAHLVRQVGEADICPVGKIKVDYCAGSTRGDSTERGKRN